jgi:hypothetical protein
MSKGRIAFQGELGANSHEACMAAYPDMEPVPHATFEDAFEAVKTGNCQLGMIPVENSVAGRVAHACSARPPIRPARRYRRPWRRRSTAWTSWFATSRTSTTTPPAS